MNIEKQLQEEISNEITYLSGMELGSEEYKVTVDGLTKLMDRAIEIKKFDIENSEREENRKIENAMKEKQMEEDRKDRIIKNSIGIASAVISSVITIWGTVVSFKYDKEGVIPSTLIGRGFINKLLPRK